MTESDNITPLELGELINQISDPVIYDCVVAHVRYVSASRTKVALIRALDDGADSGPQHSELTKQIKRLREAGADV